MNEEKNCSTNGFWIMNAEFTIGKIKSDRLMDVWNVQLTGQFENTKQHFEKSAKQKLQNKHGKKCIRLNWKFCENNEMRWESYTVSRYWLIQSAIPFPHPVRDINEIE